MERFRELSSTDLVEVVGGKKKRGFWWKADQFAKGFLYGLSH